jgi:hypothetical protein
MAEKRTCRALWGVAEHYCNGFEEGHFVEGLDTSAWWRHGIDETDKNGRGCGMVSNSVDVCENVQ